MLSKQKIHKMGASSVSMPFRLKKGNLSNTVIEKITKQVSFQSACFEWNDRKLIDLMKKLLTQATRLCLCYKNSKN